MTGWFALLLIVAVVIATATIFAAGRKGAHRTRPLRLFGDRFLLNRCIRHMRCDFTVPYRSATDFFEEPEYNHRRIGRCQTLARVFAILGVLIAHVANAFDD